MYATWALETGYGTSELWRTHNNAGGIKKTDGSGEYECYESQEEGLKAVRALIKKYVERGLHTVKQIRDVWSKTDDTDTIVRIWKEYESNE